MFSRTNEATVRHPGQFRDSVRAAEMARRGAAVRRARRDRQVADRLEAKAANLLDRARELRRRTAADLASVGLDDGR